MRKYALWFFRQMSAVRGRLLLRIIAGLLQVAFGLWLVWLCRRFIDVVIWRGNVLRETIVLFSVIALLIALRQLVFYLSGITEVILQNDMRSRLFRFVLGRKLYAVKHQAEAGPGKPASEMLSGDISQRLERDLSSASSVVTGYPAHNRSHPGAALRCLLPDAFHRFHSGMEPSVVDTGGCSLCQVSRQPTQEDDAGDTRGGEQHTDDDSGDGRT